MWEPAQLAAEIRDLPPSPDPEVFLARYRILYRLRAITEEELTHAFEEWEWGNRLEAFGPLLESKEFYARYLESQSGGNGLLGNSRPQPTPLVEERVNVGWCQGVSSSHGRALAKAKWGC